MLQFGEKQCEVCVLRDWEKAEGVRDSKICLRLGGVAKVREATVSFVMSVRLSCSPSERNNSVPTERIFMKFGNFVTVRRSVENIGLSLKPDNDNRYFT